MKLQKNEITGKVIKSRCPTKKQVTLTAIDLSSIAANALKANLWLEYYKQDEDGDTILHLLLAHYPRYGTVTRRLIDITQHPALLNITNSHGFTALHLAAMGRFPAIVRQLVIAGANPIARDNYGWVPLHCACRTGDTDVIIALTQPLTDDESKMRNRFSRLLQLPSSLQIRNHEGQAPLHIAVDKGNLAAVKLLISLGANTEVMEYTTGNIPLKIAIINRDIVMTKFFLQYYEKNPSTRVQYCIFNDIGSTLRMMGLYEQFSKVLNILKWKLDYPSKNDFS